MNQLSFKILPSPETNDHEVRIIIDNKDFLGKDYLGLDPHDFFSQENLEVNGDLMIGRCTCGCEGCGDFSINVNVEKDIIIWKIHSELDFKFSKTNYLNTIRNAKVDFSWEDIYRRVERLSKNILKNSRLKNGHTFDWASARIKQNLIIFSYSNNGRQMMFEIHWDGRTENEIEERSKDFLIKNCI